MSWRESLRPASFRTVPFYVTESELSGGRKYVQHAYPYVDRIITEGTGRKPKRFQLNAFVIGDDFIQKKLKLIEALESPEDGGTLIHPFYGTLRIIVADYKVKNTLDKGRMAQIEIEFEEFYDEEIQSDPSDALIGEQLNDQLFDLTKGNFLFALDGPAFIAESALETAANAADSMVKDLAQLSAKNPRISAVAFQLQRIRRSGKRILRTPELIANAYRAALFELTTSFAPRQSVDYIKKYFKYSLFIPTIKPISKVSEIEDRNNKSVAKVIEKTMLGQAIRVLSSTSFPEDLKPLLKEETITFIEDDLQSASDIEYPLLFSAKTLALKFPKASDSVMAAAQKSEGYFSIPFLYEKTGNISNETLQSLTNDIKEIQP